jgi:REP element-mobilizing transposase RayT
MNIAWDDFSFAPRVQGRQDPRLVMAEWLRDFRPWSHWYYMTFTRPFSRGDADNVVRTFVMTLARDLRVHVWAAWSVEPDSSGHHIHGLLDIPPPHNLDDDALRAHGRRVCHSFGHSRFDRFDRTRGGPWYMVKSVEPDINVGCPRPPRCRRFGGCADSRFSWPKKR